jgi:hypothetical protein
MTKDETGKKVINDDIFFMNKDDENNNCKVNSELFNNYFLTTAEKNSCHIPNNIKVDRKNNKNSLSCHRYCI